MHDQGATSFFDKSFSASSVCFKTALWASAIQNAWRLTAAPVSPLQEHTASTCRCASSSCSRVLFFKAAGKTRALVKSEWESLSDEPCAGQGGQGRRPRRLHFIASSTDCFSVIERQDRQLPSCFFNCWSSHTSIHAMPVSIILEYMSALTSSHPLFHSLGTLARPIGNEHEDSYFFVSLV